MIANLRSCCSAVIQISIEQLRTTRTISVNQTIRIGEQVSVAHDSSLITPDFPQSRLRVITKLAAHVAVVGISQSGNQLVYKTSDPT